MDFNVPRMAVYHSLVEAAGKRHFIGSLYVGRMGSVGSC